MLCHLPLEWLIKLICSLEIIGAAYIYDISVLVSPETKLLASDADIYSQFGWATAVYGDVAVVSAYHDNNEGIFVDLAGFILRLYFNLIHFPLKVLSTCILPPTAG